MKNKRWREYAQDFLGWSDPQEGRLWKLQHAFKAGYDACEKDVSQPTTPADQKISGFKRFDDKFKNGEPKTISLNDFWPLS